MPYDLQRKGAQYHKLVVDSDSREMVCICGEPKCDASGKKRAKFHNKGTEYNGVIYDSQLEMRIAVDLDWRLKAKDIKSWDRQIKIAFVICPKCSRLTASHCPDHPDERQFSLANYWVDFRVHHKNGDTEYIEGKGFEMGEWKMKWRMMEAVYGRIEGIKLTVIKENQLRSFKR